MEALHAIVNIALFFFSQVLRFAACVQRQECLPSELVERSLQRKTFWRLWTRSSNPTLNSAPPLATWLTTKFLPLKYAPPWNVCFLPANSRVLMCLVISCDIKLLNKNIILTSYYMSSFYCFRSTNIFPVQVSIPRSNKYRLKGTFEE